MNDEIIEIVCELVADIPPGRVMTYGDIAGFVPGLGPRMVGRIMKLGGHDLPWWRVVGAGGRPVPGAEAECLAHFEEEGTPLKPAGTPAGYRVDYRQAAWRPELY